MGEQSLSSLLGVLSTKAPLASGISKTSSNSIQTSHGGNGFHAKLINSMKDASTDDSQIALFSSSDIDNTKNTKEFNQIIEMASLNLSNGIDGNQIQLNHDADLGIAMETIANLIANNNTNVNSVSNQTQTRILSDNILLNQDAKAQKSKTLLAPGSSHLKILKESTFPLSDKPNANIKENSPLAILDSPTKHNPKVTDQKSASAMLKTNTLLDNVLPFQDSKAQESNSLIEPKSNLLKVLNETTTPLPDKTNSNQTNLDGNNPISKLAGTINSTSTVSDQTSTSTQAPANIVSNNNILPGDRGLDLQNNMKASTAPFIDNSNTNQSNSIIREHDIFGMPNANKVALEETSTQQRGATTNPISTLLNTNNNPGQAQNTATLEHYSNTINNNSNDNSRLNVEKESANPALQTSSTFNRHSSVSNAMFDAKDTITTNNAINHNTLLNPEESASGKIVENPREQQSDKISTISTSTKSTSQQNLAKIDSSNNESSIIFNTNPNSADTNIAKPSDNSALANNNGINIGEISSSVNTSSDNSSYNNQGSDVLSEFNINSVNARKNAVPETNFNDTLSQINNVSKPLGTLGNDVADNIIQSAKLYIEGGKSEIKMQLNPQELGSLKLEFTVDDDILDAKITVERSAVKDIIEKDIPRLRELISGADIDVGKLDVSLQEKENERFGYKEKDFQPDSGNNSTQGSPDQGKEDLGNEAEEESITKNTNADQINYLV
ncbi:MAG: flagellar hook-length control protein FliK [Candidatus Brocadiaceae bacterium]|nr:flagellar hook-length control protein FliK [Candidatus Brocadiaceae bacterium]